MKNTIAVCIARLDENFQTNSLKSICKRANECGLSIQVYNVFEELAERDLYDKGEESIFELINYDRLCGIILFYEKIKDNDLNRRLIEAGKEHGLPVVCVDRYMEECYSITFDYANSFEKIVRHLIEVHHCKTFFMMAGFRNNSFSDERIEAVRRVLGEYGMRLTADDIGYGDFWTDPCRKVMKEFLNSGRPLPDAFIAANDTMAITICNELESAGYHVPQDTIVTGFDGIEMERYVVPRLTTAQQNIELSGETAVDIIERIRNGEMNVPKHHIIPFAIRYAQSCGCQPIVYNSVSQQINDLYNNLTDFRQFSKFMYEMIIDMTSKKTIGNMIRYLEKYIPYLTGYHHIYVCVHKLLLADDEEMMNRLDQNHRIANTPDMAQKDMVVLCEWHEDRGFSVPLTRFGYEEQLPDYENVIKDMQHVIFVPLHMQDTVFGYMAFDMEPESNDYYKINNIAMNLGHCMDSVRQQLKTRKMNDKLRQANDKLEDLYIRDPLTGIYNRRGFYQELNRRLKKYAYGWLLMVSVDLDGLKPINDGYGHSEGDFAIKTVGKAIASCSEECGVCARFGGDEFAAALFFHEYEESVEQTFKQKLEEYLEKANEKEKKPYRIAASCGTKLGMIDHDLDLDALLKDADNKMYISKDQHHSRLREKSRNQG